MIGYSLPLTGLVAILLAALSVYAVFTNKQEPVPLFNFPAISIPVSSLMAEVPNSANMPEVELFPADTLNAPANTTAHLFLMGFMVTAGGKIASLGTYLLRPIVIKAKEDNGQKTA